jgi:hypothetical protein
MLRYFRRMWTIGCSQPHDQLNASFETAPKLGEALSRLAILKHAHPDAHVWASGDFYDVAARRTEAQEVAFVVRPTAETDVEPPVACRPYSASELLELATADAAVLPAEEECPTCGQRRRGRHANRSESGQPLFLCSTCGQWTETLPKAVKPGSRSRRSNLAS